MALISKEKILEERLDFMPAKEFAEKYTHGISQAAIYYAMNKDLIDEFTPAKERFVVMTEKTRRYVPTVRAKRTSTMQLRK